jgi:hypothetical protein
MSVSFRARFTMAFKLTYTDGQADDYDDSTAWAVEDGVLKMGRQSGKWTVLVSPSHWATVEIAQDKDKGDNGDKDTNDKEKKDKPKDDGDDGEDKQREDKRKAKAKDDEDKEDGEDEVDDDQDEKS